MKAAGTVEVTARPEDLWAALDDPERLAGAIAEVDAIELLDAGDGRFRALLRARTALGPIPLRTEWRRTEHTPPSALGYAVAGRADEFLVDLDVVLRLDPAGDATRVRWEVDVRATGAMASAGQRTLAAVAGHHVELVLRAAARLSAR